MVPKRINENQVSSSKSLRNRSKTNTEKIRKWKLYKKKWYQLDFIPAQICLCLFCLLNWECILADKLLQRYEKVRQIDVICIHKMHSRLEILESRQCKNSDILRQLRRISNWILSKQKWRKVKTDENPKLVLQTAGCFVQVKVGD